MIIYKWTNKENGKIYVGQTTQSLTRRTKGHINTAAAGSTLPLHAAIRKYGQDAFIIEKIAESSTLEGLNALEVHYIQLLNCLAPNGYNLNGGGFNHNQHPETRKKISIAAKLRIKADNGAQFQAALAKAREALKGKDPWNKGKIASIEARANQSVAHVGQKAWNKGQVTSSEVRNKQRIAALNRSKKVQCLETLQIWDSIEECSRAVSISTTHIKRLIKSGKQSKLGLTFKFVESL